MLNETPLKSDLVDQLARVSDHKTPDYPAPPAQHLHLRHSVKTNTVYQTSAVCKLDDNNEANQLFASKYNYNNSGSMKKKQKMRIVADDVIILCLVTRVVE